MRNEQLPLSLSALGDLAEFVVQYRYERLPPVSFYRYERGSVGSASGVVTGVVRWWVWMADVRFVCVIRVSLCPVCVPAPPGVNDIP